MEEAGRETSKVVFLGHNASRTGAPIALLHLLRWLNRNTALRSELLLLAGGPLVDAYRHVVPTSVIGVDGVHSYPLKVIERSVGALTKRPPRGLARLPELRQGRRLASRCTDADLVYVNSFEAAWVLHHLRSAPPTLLHLHEMSYGLRHLAFRSPARGGMTEDEYVGKTLDLADAILVPSEVNRREVLAIAPSIDPRCRVIPEMIDVNAVQASTRPSSEIRAELGIPSQALVVAACGSFDWRKASDLFVQVAARVIADTRSEPVYFMWIGVPSDPAFGTIAWSTRRQFDFDARSLGVAERMILVPPVPDAAPYVGAADVFLLPSREDPFPLAAIEAAALGKPIVCFDSAGTAEMIGEGAGTVIPYLDVPAMSAAVQSYLEDPEARRSAGALAAERAAEYEVSKIMPRVLAAVSDLLARSAEPSRPSMRA
jgi:glycosyltransferase involved in cell wall biosynthesis